MKSPVHGFVFVVFFCFLFFVFTIFTIHQWQVLSAFLSLTKLQCLCIPLDFFFKFFFMGVGGRTDGELELSFMFQVVSRNKNSGS